MKILVLVVRSLRGSGFSTRIESMLESYLANGDEVDVFHFRFPHEDGLSSRIAGSLGRYVTIPLDGKRYRSHMSLLPPIAWQCRFACAGSDIETEGYDVVQAETSSTWTVARTVPAPRRVLVLHDDDASRLRGLAKTAADPAHRAIARVTASKYSRWQRTCLREADRVWFVSSVELARLGSNLPGRKARLIPNGAGDELWSVPLPSEGAAHEVLFIAPGFYEANVFGLAWFLRCAWPLVKERVPRAHLRVVGRGWEGFGSYPDVSFVGWRDSLADEYSRGRLAIAPLFAGGGTKLKVVEAMASGRPVVASSTGAEGIVPTDGVRISDDPRGFAEEVIGFLLDAEQASQAGAANRYAVDGLRWSRVWDAAALDLRLVVSGDSQRSDRRSPA